MSFILCSCSFSQKFLIHVHNVCLLQSSLFLTKYFSFFRNLLSSFVLRIAFSRVICLLNSIYFLGVKLVAASFPLTCSGLFSTVSQCVPSFLLLLNSFFVWRVSSLIYSHPSIPIKSNYKMPCLASPAGLHGCLVGSDSQQRFH